MKVFYDFLCFTERFGGVSKSFVKIIKNLPGDISYTIPIKYTNNEYIKELPDIKVHRISNRFNFKGSSFLLNIPNKLNSVNKLLHSDFDVYHQTHYDPYAYKYISSKTKTVTTIHDMNFFVIPDIYKFLILPYPAWQKISAFKADKIITVSNNSKKDIINIWNIPEEKIEVVYHGVEHINPLHFKAKGERLFKAPYILFVGLRLFQKNFENYLASFKIVSQSNRDLLLVCTGRPFTRNEQKRIGALHLVDKVVQITVDEDSLVKLYADAELFVYPSLYEGFGLPLLEAMNCKCPVVCSNTSCFPEIAGNAAKYFDPYSIESMAEVTNEVLNNSSLKQKLAGEGLARVKMFSWKTCADKHAEVYKSLL